MKKILITISFVIVLLLGALLSLPYWFDVNYYKDEIASTIKDKSGVSVLIKGKITARVLPNLALMLEDVSLQSSFENDADVISTNQLILKVKLAPLLKNKLEIDSLKLVKPVINLQIKSTGEANWEPQNHDSRTLSKDDDEVTELSYVEHDVSNKYLHNRFILNDLTIKNGSFKFVDEKSGQEINITNINLRTSVKPGDNNFALSGKADLFANKEKGKFSLGGLYFIGDDKYHVDNIAIKLDGIEASSNIIVDLGMGRPSVKVALYTTDINLNDYKLASDDNSSVATENVSSPVEYEPIVDKFSLSSEKLEIGDLNAADIDFNFKTSGIKYNNISLGETVVYSYLRSGRLTINLKNSKVYGGLVKSEFVLDGASGLPTLKSEFIFKNIDLNQIPADLVSLDGLNGNASGDIKVYTTGDNEKDLVSNLNGKSSINITAGSIKGIDLFSMVNNISSAFKIRDISRGTKFQELSGNFKITNGLVSNDNLVLKSDVMNLEGEGSVNLVDLSIDYKLTPKYSQDFESNELRGPKVPIVVTGNITHPIFRLEVKSIVQDLINNPKGGENLVKQLKRDFKDIKNDFNNNTIKDLKSLFK